MKKVSLTSFQFRFVRVALNELKEQSKFLGNEINFKHKTLTLSD